MTLDKKVKVGPQISTIKDICCCYFEGNASNLNIFVVIWNISFSDFERKNVGFSLCTYFSEFFPGLTVHTHQ